MRTISFYDDSEGNLRIAFKNEVDHCLNEFFRAATDKDKEDYKAEFEAYQALKVSPVVESKIESEIEAVLDLKPEPAPIAPVIESKEEVKI